MCLTRALHCLVPILLGTFLLAACSGQRPLDLGASNGRLKACPASPNCVASQTDEAGHRIAPLSFAESPVRAWARLAAVLAARGDTTVITVTDTYLRVEFHTLLGFVDDGEFLLDAAQGQIAMRSAARLGYSDFGKNRARLEEIRAAFASGGDNRPR